MCLELLCTSTQSNHLKWVSGGGINSLRHQTSRWLKAVEKGSVGWTDAMLFQGVGSSGAPPTSFCHWGSLNFCSGAMHWRCVGSSGAEDPAPKSPLLAFTRPSDRPTLHLDQGVGSSGAEGFVLAHLYMNSNWVSDGPTVSPLRLSDHPVLLSLLLFHCNSSDATKRWTVGSSDGA
jgi:hypothetical protein